MRIVLVAASWIASVLAVNYDYYTFSREWDPGFCIADKCKGGRRPTREDFTIHGLWPSYFQGDLGPFFCHGEPPNINPPFDYSSLQPLESELKEQWPSFKMGARAFWEYEWGKHGSCAEASLGDEYSYFSTTLALHKKYDLLTYLHQAGIYASNSTYASVDKVLKAIDDGVGGVDGATHLKCKNGVLAEVYTCLDLNLQPITCPRFARQSGCNPYIIPELSTSAVRGEATVQVA